MPGRATNRALYLLGLRADPTARQVIVSWRFVSWIMLCALIAAVVFTYT